MGGSERKPTRKRPSSRPARLMVGAGAVAAVSVIAAGLVRFPIAVDEPVAAGSGQPTAKSSGQAVGKSKAAKRRQASSKRPVKYIRLKPGQKAPKGAKVIREAAPTPRIVVQRSAPSVQRSTPSVQRRGTRVVTRTRQSG